MPIEVGQAAPGGAQREGGSRPCETEIEIRTPEINRYLYENLVSNVESQIEHWNRKAARQ